MKLVLSFILLCSTWSAFAGNELAECADIESAVERLDCYDRLARERAGTQGNDVPPERARAAEVEPAPQAAEPATESRPAAPPGEPADRGGAVARWDDGGGAADSFGLVGKRGGSAEEAEHIRARIESIRRAPLGQHVMTLSNGQVWMENEPGRRPIAADQEVTIRKQRWHYEMELVGRPNVAVRRVK